MAICLSTPHRSFRQATDHGQYAVSDTFQLRIDIGKRTRWLENIEVPVKWDLVADLGFLVIDPRIFRMRQDFAFEVGVDVLA